MENSPKNWRELKNNCPHAIIYTFCYTYITKEEKNPTLYNTPSANRTNIQRTNNKRKKIYENCKTFCITITRQRQIYRFTIFRTITQFLTSSFLPKKKNKETENLPLHIYIRHTYITPCDECVSVSLARNTIGYG